MWLFLAFVAVPLIEISLFVQIGGAIGLWPTLLIVILTAMLGTWLVRNQGRLAMNDIRQSFQTMNDPGKPLAHGAMILISGVLLLTPGFFTDALGFALLIPPIRRAIIAQVSKRVEVREFEMGPRRGPAHDPRFRQPDVIETDEYEDVTDEPRRRGNSGWTRH